MPAVYSYSLHQEQGQNGSRSFTSPAGTVTVIRDIEAYGDFGIGGGGQLNAIGSDGQTFVWWTWGGSEQGARHWDGRVVIEPGATWGITTDAAIDVTVSGYLLSSP